MTHAELAEMTRQHLALAISDLGVPGPRPYGMSIAAVNVAMLDGIALFLADYVHFGAQPNPVSRAVAADYAVRRLLSQVEVLQTEGSA